MIDLLDLATIAGGAPAAMYAHLRKTAPVHRDPERDLELGKEPVWRLRASSRG
jgi:hypothetical protein